MWVVQKWYVGLYPRAIIYARAYFLYGADRAKQ